MDTMGDHMSETKSTPAGWYNDGSGRQRWWDGTTWGAYQPQASAQPPLAKLSGYAVAGLIVGIVSVFGLIIPTAVSLVLPVGAILFSGVGLWETQKQGKRGQKIAAAGMIIGAVVAFIIFLIMMIIANVH